MKRIYFATVPLFAGGMIYLLWRVETLTMFSWFERLGLGGFVGLLRANVKPHLNHLPDWFLFSLPNALWFFSGLSIIDFIWGVKSSGNKLFWISFFCVIALGSEGAQAFHIIPGVYDYQDLTLMVIAGVCSALLVLFTNRSEKGMISHAL